jgi:pseudouridine synthase
VISVTNNWYNAYMQNDQPILQRLDKLISHAGYAPRSAVKRFLKTHEVLVNGKRVKESGFRIHMQQDTITIDNEQIDTKASQYVYYALNKPLGVISTTDDNLGRENVTELIDTDKRIYPIGRLDKDTHGLLLLTNDGTLTHQLIHPKYHVPKVYHLTVAETPSDEQLQAFRTGILLREGVTLPAENKIIKQGKEQTVIELTLHEGRYRQIRRMCEHIGIELLDLQRISFGPIILGTLKPGEYRQLSTEEIDALKKVVERK